MAQRLTQTLDFISKIDSAKNAEGVTSSLLSVTKQFGFENVLAGIIPAPGMSATQQAENVVLHQWPDEWSSRYFTQGYLFDDPTIRRLTNSAVPFSWAELTPELRDNDRAARVMNEAKDFGLESGFTLTLITVEGYTAGFSFAANRFDVAPHQCGMLQLLASYSFAKALSFRNPEKPIHLTDREREIMNWVADGKSDWEIGEILSISEHTVDKHLRQARTKLNAVSRAQAVANAIRHRLIP